MLKNWLKISASVVVLLGMVAIKDCASAMEWTEEDKTEHSSSVVSGRSKKEPDPSTNSENDECKESTVLAPGQILPNELLQHTFSFLDYKDKVMATKVCALWNFLIEKCLPYSFDYSKAFLAYCHKNRSFDKKSFDKAFVFLKKYHSQNLNIWKVYDDYLINRTFFDSNLLDSESIQEFLSNFQTFFPKEGKTKLSFNLSLRFFPQYQSALGFLNWPMNDLNFVRGVDFLDARFSHDEEAWKVFADYLHELWCDYDTTGRLIGIKKDAVSVFQVCVFIQDFNKKFPDAQSHPSIVSLSKAMSFDNKEHLELYISVYKRFTRTGS